MAKHIDFPVVFFLFNAANRIRNGKENENIEKMWIGKYQIKFAGKTFSLFDELERRISVHGFLYQIKV